MIIDTHMHISYKHMIDQEMADFLKNKNLWEKMLPQLSPAGIIAALDKNGIDKGVIFPLTMMPESGRWQELNQMTAEYVQSSPQRLIGLAIINPRNIRESLRDLERCASELNLSGIKFHPTEQEFYPNSLEMDPVYEFCVEKGWPFLCHTGASVPTHPDKFSRPMLLDEVAVRHPELKLILAHSGRPFYQEAALLLRKHKNVYVDLCANIGRTGGTLLMEGILGFIKIYADGLNKALFGSDFPVFVPAETIEQIKTAVKSPRFEMLGFPEISDQEIQGILGENAAKIFGLDTIKE